MKVIGVSRALLAEKFYTQFFFPALDSSCETDSKFGKPSLPPGGYHAIISTATHAPLCRRLFVDGWPGLRRDRRNGEDEKISDRYRHRQGMRLLPP